MDNYKNQKNKLLKSSITLGKAYTTAIKALNLSPISINQHSISDSVSSLSRISCETISSISSLNSNDWKPIASGFASIFKENNISRIAGAVKFCEDASFNLSATDIAIKTLDSIIGGLEMLTLHLDADEIDNNFKDYSDISLEKENIEMPNNISIADMDKICQGKEINNDQPLITYKEFKRELIAIKLSNGFNELLPQFYELYYIADQFIDYSFKQELYKKMSDLILETFAHGLVFIGIVLFMALLNFELRDYKIYRDFLSKLKEILNSLKD